MPFNCIKLARSLLAVKLNKKEKENYLKVKEKKNLNQKRINKFKIDLTSFKAIFEKSGVKSQIICQCSLKKKERLVKTVIKEILKIRI